MFSQRLRRLGHKMPNSQYQRLCEVKKLINSGALEQAPMRRRSRGGAAAAAAKADRHLPSGSGAWSQVRLAHPELYPAHSSVMHKIVILIRLAIIVKGHLLYDPSLAEFDQSRSPTCRVC